MTALPIENFSCNGTSFTLTAALPLKIIFIPFSIEKYSWQKNENKFYVYSYSSVLIL
jgi:hypothetical protein